MSALGLAPTASLVSFSSSEQESDEHAELADDAAPDDDDAVDDELSGITVFSVAKVGVS